ncbi:MAG: MarR family transcriptional regulator [Chloroherpetonaceae bacterium]|nr:MarR family transcriptional regulator [Chloroherpetonaceae bacterium]MDW8437810.1 MarR family transcriptional regulator [Chloroherpetonaceae bacterium]
MSLKEKIKREVLREYGDGYHAFGLNRVMGHIVGLLLFANEPLSLDDICKQLGRSKGVVSQIMRRLVERNLVRKVLSTGTRKDFYEIHPSVFENAFRNNLELIRNNARIAHRLKDLAEQSDDASLAPLQLRLAEMARFYELTEEHYENFLKEWQAEREKIHLKFSRNGKKKTPTK